MIKLISNLLENLHILQNIYIKNNFFFKKKSYSMDKEDLVIDKYFKNKNKGFYVDVGCYHPLQRNNIILLYQKGWRGINIDISDFSIKLLNKQVQIVISNPPYITSIEKNKMSQLILKNEPHLALFVEGEDDILFYKKIINSCEHILVSGGKLYFELNPLTAQDLLSHCERLGLSCELKSDWSGHCRFAKIHQKKA